MFSIWHINKKSYLDDSTILEKSVLLNQQSSSHVSIVKTYQAGYPLTKILIVKHVHIK